MKLSIKASLIILILFSSASIYCQGFDSELRATPAIFSKIVYKDGTSEKGMLWLASSAFQLRLKEGKRNKKIDYNKIDKIVTNPDAENERTFQYLHHNYDKFKIFVELVYSDEISIYISSRSRGNTTDLFYSDFDRTTIREKLMNVKQDRQIPNSINSNSIELPNGEKIKMSKGFSRFNIMTLGSSFKIIPPFQQYILKKGVKKLMKVEKNKRFLKKSREFFKECTSLIEDLEQEIITLDDLPVFIEYYKRKCKEKENVYKN